MTTEAIVKLIHSLYRTISGKSDIEVFVIFKGTDYGVSKPYIARIEAKEFSHETFDGALQGLLIMLKNELSSKVRSAEGEAKRLRSVLSELDN